MQIMRILSFNNWCILSNRHRFRQLNNANSLNTHTHTSLCLCVFREALPAPATNVNITTLQELYLHLWAYCCVEQVPIACHCTHYPALLHSDINATLCTYSRSTFLQQVAIQSYSALDFVEPYNILLLNGTLFFWIF